MEFSELEFGQYFTKYSKFPQEQRKNVKIFRKLIGKKEPGKKVRPLFYTPKIGAHSITINVNCCDQQGKLIYMDVTTKVEEVDLLKEEILAAHQKGEYLTSTEFIQELKEELEQQL